MGTHLSTLGHGKTTTALSTVNTTADTVASLTAINCSGYTKLLVTYTTVATWNTVGTIKIYGSIDGTNFVLADATVENASFSVANTDDDGEYYVVENIPPKIKVGWNKASGSGGTLTAKVMPFND